MIGSVLGGSAASLGDRQRPWGIGSVLGGSAASLGDRQRPWGIGSVLGGSAASLGDWQRNHGLVRREVASSRETWRHHNGCGVVTIKVR